MSELSKTKVGSRLYCGLCGQPKKPIGRAAPMELRYCDDDCGGYMSHPLPGSLWPVNLSLTSGTALVNKEWKPNKRRKHD